MKLHEIKKLKKPKLRFKMPRKDNSNRWKPDPRYYGMSYYGDADYAGSSGEGGGDGGGE